MYVHHKQNSRRLPAALAAAVLACAFIAPQAMAAGKNAAPARHAVVSVGQPVSLMVGRHVSAHARVVEDDGRACGFVTLPAKAEAALTSSPYGAPLAYSGRTLVCTKSSHRLPGPGGSLLVDGRVARVLSSRYGPVPLVWLDGTVD